MHPLTSSLGAVIAASLLGAAPVVARAQSNRAAPVDVHDSIDVASLTFRGADSVSAADLRTVIFTRASTCRLMLLYAICQATPNQLFTDRRRTTRAALGDDITSLRVYYFRRGYREAQVDTLLAPATRGIAVTFQINEGPLTRIASLDVTQREPVIPADEMRHAVTLRAGGALDLFALDTTVRRLRNAAWNQGYGDVRIDTSVPRPDASRLVPVRIVVDPRYLTRVGEVEFEGNRVLSDATLRRAVLLRPGELYTRSAVLESEFRLFQSPAIARALVVTPPQGDSVKRITVAVSESAPHHVSASAGVNTVEFGQVAVVMRDNMLGDGRWLDVRARVGNLLGQQLNGRSIFRQAVPEGIPDANLFLEPTYQGSLTVTQPWIASPRTSASVTLFGGRRALPGVVVDEDLGARMGVVHELAIQLPVGVGYRMELTRVRAGGVYFCAAYGICDDATAQALTRRQRVAPVTVSGWIDRSNDLETPTTGYTAVVDAEHASSATGSTFAHNRLAVDAALYHALGGGDENANEIAMPRVLALHGRVGWVRPLNDRAALGIPGSGDGILFPRARFYAGGMQSVRGFAENELGPQVLEARSASLLAAGCTSTSIADGSCNPTTVPSNQLFVRPTGGSSVIEASAELRMPLVKQFGAVLFVDGAYVGTAGIDSPASGRGAVTPGAGLRYRSVLGVLRLDVGLRPVGSRLLPVVVAVPDGAGGQRIVRLSQEKSYSPIEPSPGTLHTIARQLVVHFAMGQAY